MAFSDIINRELLSAALGQFKTKLATVFAPLSSPAMTGTPTAPTAEAGTDSTQIATTAFVKTAVSAEVAAHDVVAITLPSIGTLPMSFNMAQTGLVSSDMVMVHSVLSNPSAQLCDWRVIVTETMIRIEAVTSLTNGGISRSTDLTLYLEKRKGSSDTAPDNIIKKQIAFPANGYYYSRTFRPDDDESIFASFVSSGQINAYRLGDFICVRMNGNFTFSQTLSAGTGYTIATLPENARIAFVQENVFTDGTYHGRVAITAANGEITVTPYDTDIPAGTGIQLFMPIFSVTRDRDDSDLSGYTLVEPNA